jgi:hypothetical protein
MQPAPKPKSKPSARGSQIKVYLHAGGSQPPSGMKVLRAATASERWTTNDLRAVLSDMVRLADPKASRISYCHFQQCFEGTDIYAEGDSGSEGVRVFPAFRVPPTAIAGLIPLGRLNRVSLSFLPILRGKARGKQAPKRVGGGR